MLESQFSAIATQEPGWARIRPDRIFGNHTGKPDQPEVSSAA